MENKSIKIEKQDALEENVLRWESVQQKLKDTLGEQIYSSWLKNIKLIKEYNHYVVLGVQTRFFRDWITSRYADKILDEIKKHKLSINRIEFKIHEEKTDIKSVYTKNTENNVSDIKESALNYNRLNPELNFNNFVIGESNKLAFMSAKKNMQSTL
tara:strand:+ start:892 stop:1359 length:468 start_codon:yes stop_codon:yes gene_type:complete